MNDIKIFENPDFGSVRITEDTESNQLLFCAMDVCTALGYSNGRDAVYKHVEKDDVVKCDTTDSIGRIQQLTYVTESGLYSLIFGSKQERAKTRQDTHQTERGIQRVYERDKHGV